MKYFCSCFQPTKLLANKNKASQRRNQLLRPFVVDLVFNDGEKASCQCREEKREMMGRHGPSGLEWTIWLSTLSLTRKIRYQWTPVGRKWLINWSYWKLKNFDDVFTNLMYHKDFLRSATVMERSQLFFRFCFNKRTVAIWRCNTVHSLTCVTRWAPDGSSSHGISPASIFTIKAVTKEKEVQVW